MTTGTAIASGRPEDGRAVTGPQRRAPGSVAAPHPGDARRRRRDSLRTRFGPYLELAKPEITLLVALSSAGGFLLAPAAFDPGRLGLLLAAVILASAGAGALNHWMERDHDAAMRRTVGRPLPSGRLRPPAARSFGVLLAALGAGLGCLFVNLLTGGLVLLTVLLYLFAYTPLKRRSHWNTLVGTVPGALPALCGWTAATGSVGWGGIAAFSIVAAWQMPHFLPLAWMYREDYRQGGFVMLPVVDPSGRSTVRQTLFFAALLAGVSLWPFALSLAGWSYAVGAAALGGWFLRAAGAFYRTRAVPDARRVLMVSVRYLPALILLLVIDRLALGGLS